MKYYIYIIIITGFLLLLQCSKSEITLPGGANYVSEIKNQTNYYAPIVLMDTNNRNITLNNEIIKFRNNEFELNEPGFYKMVKGDNTDTIQFVLLDEERGESEWGLMKWVPQLPLYDNDFSGKIDVIHPKYYVTGISIPFILITYNHSFDDNINIQCNVNGENDFNIKRGIGSVQFETSNLDGIVHFNAGNQQIIVNVEPLNHEVTRLNVIIDKKTTIKAHSFVQIDNDLVIEKDAELVIEEGCIIAIDAGVNIINFGPIRFEGSLHNPIHVTCTNSSKQFGGFISEGQNSNITGEFTFFTNFAHHSSSEYQYGHAKHQALFKANGNKLLFTNCYFLDTPGQVFYPIKSSIEIVDCVIQRAKTAGQINSSNLTITNSYFSDFPDDTQTYIDLDNDALYLSASDAEISGSVFMYAKDDGIDSGGSEGGTVFINNCIFEACFHEGLALSSTFPSIKKHYIRNTTVINCQQGIELGYSSRNHSVYIENCNIFNNYVGVRYGDNYKNKVEGVIALSGNNIYNNQLNSWNMVRKEWKPYSDKLIFNLE